MRYEEQVQPRKHSFESINAMSRNERVELMDTEARRLESLFDLLMNEVRNTDFGNYLLKLGLYSMLQTMRGHTFNLLDAAHIEKRDAKGESDAQ